MNSSTADHPASVGHLPDHSMPPFLSLDGLQLITPELMLRLEELNGESNAKSVPYRAYTSLRSMALFEEGTALRNLLTIIYWTTALLSLVGNLFAVAVLHFGRRQGRRGENLGDMRIYLFNLGLADIGMALFGLFTFTHFVDNYWALGPWLCCPVAALQTASIFASVYTLTTISLTSFLFTWRPLQATAMTAGVRVRIAVGIWVAGGLLGVYNWHTRQAVPFRLVSEADRAVYYDCRPTPASARPAFLLNFVVTFVVPVTVLLVAYTLVIRYVLVNSTGGGGGGGGGAPAVEGHEVLSARNSRSRRRLLRVLVLLVGLFFLCWMPIQVWFLLSQLQPQWLHQHLVGADSSNGTGTGTGGPSRQTVYNLLTLAFHWLAMANSFLNPFIYYFLNPHFMADLEMARRRLANWWNTQVDFPAEHWQRDRRRRQTLRRSQRMVLPVNGIGPRGLAEAGAGARAEGGGGVVVEEAIELEELQVAAAAGNGEGRNVDLEEWLEANHEARSRNSNENANNGGGTFVLTVDVVEQAEEMGNEPEPEQQQVPVVADTVQPPEVVVIDAPVKETD
ncbi:hypothetical protein TYRP_008586 [Tyrophagus putrescentiae]|nr:hypothetical protein TYRP_008586 [Tyrophagus putrescentiae]